MSNSDFNFDPYSDVASGTGLGGVDKIVDA